MPWARPRHGPSAAPVAHRPPRRRRRPRRPRRAGSAPGAARLPRPRARLPRRTVPWYRREGAVTAVLAVAGAVITMAGVAMLLVLAAQHGWFGPGARVTAGAVLAGLLVALGVRGAEADRRTDRGVVGSRPGGPRRHRCGRGLPRRGRRDQWLRLGVARRSGSALAGAVALGGLHLARRWGSELLAVLLVLGAAALAPFVAQGGGWVVSAFLAVLCVAGWWAGGSRTRPALTVVRVVPVTLSLLVGAVTEAGTGAGAVGQVGRRRRGARRHPRHLHALGATRRARRVGLDGGGAARRRPARHLGDARPTRGAP